MISISFCIPTRNFGAYIGATLENLAAQCGPADEIVIVDGNSTDDTPQIVDRFARHFPRLVYERRTVNGGVDRDLALSVERASSDYCWLFSADDGLVAGAVAKVRHLLERAPDVLLTERFDCDNRLRPLNARRWLAAAAPVSTHELGSDAGVLEYLGRVRSLAALFSYVSCIVVRRDRWIGVQPRESAWGTNYAHVNRLLDLLRTPPASLSYVAQPLVLARGGNDSFMQQGRIRRFLIDVDGYRLIGANVFAQRPDLRAAFFAAFRRDHDLVSLVGIRSRIDEPAVWQSIRAKLAEMGYPAGLLSLAGVLAAFRPLVRAASALRRACTRLVGRLRGDRGRTASP